MISQILHLLFLLLHLLLHEEAYLNNHSSLEPEILDLNRFSSELVHRHILFLLTLLLLEKIGIISPYNASHVYVKTGKAYNQWT